MEQITIRKIASDRVEYWIVCPDKDFDHVGCADDYDEALKNISEVLELNKEVFSD